MCIRGLLKSTQLDPHPKIRIFMIKYQNTDFGMGVSTLPVHMCISYLMHNLCKVICLGSVGDIYIQLNMHKLYLIDACFFSLVSTSISIYKNKG